MQLRKNIVRSKNCKRELINRVDSTVEEQRERRNAERGATMWRQPPSNIQPLQFPRQPPPPLPINNRPIMQPQTSPRFSVAPPQQQQHGYHGNVSRAPQYSNRPPTVVYQTNFKGHQPPSFATGCHGNARHPATAPYISKGSHYSSGPQIQGQQLAQKSVNYQENRSAIHLKEREVLNQKRISVEGESLRSSHQAPSDPKQKMNQQFNPNTSRRQPTSGNWKFCKSFLFLLCLRETFLLCFVQ